MDYKIEETSKGIFSLKKSGKIIAYNLQFPLSNLEELNSWILGYGKSTKSKDFLALKYNEKYGEDILNLEDGVLLEKFIYHTSNPISRDYILLEGLVPKPKSNAWLEDTKIDGEVIFCSNTSEPSKMFDSGYNDDIYRIDTSKINFSFFKDPNFDFFEGHCMVYCRKKIPLEAIELVYKGDGENCDDGPSLEDRFNDI